MSHVSWQSELSAEQVFQESDSFQYPTLYNGGVVYLQKDQNNRLVLRFQQQIDDPKGTICLTPEPFSLRTKINEYGGKPYWIYGDHVWFINQTDQCLYRQSLNSERMSEVTLPVAVTQQLPNQINMFAELCPLNGDLTQSMLAIVESHDTSFADIENRHTIGIIDSITKKVSTLVEGADFYSNLVVDVENQRIAWVQWNHPNMPWDNNELWVADLLITDAKVTIQYCRQVDLGATASYCQLFFANNGRLFFSVDFAGKESDSVDNYWNIKCIDLDNDDIQPVTSMLKEFGYPHWQYGDHRIVQFTPNSLLASGSSPQSDTLYEIDQQTLAVSEFPIGDETLFTIQGLNGNAFGKAAAILMTQSKPAALIVMDGHDDLQFWQSNQQTLDQDDISLAEHIEYQTADQQSAYAFYYRPTNQLVQLQSPPPLIVMVHGGPTSRAYGHFDIQKQFWTNRGFAILDVNHRGSSGYGRHYRDALYGQWGERDAQDIMDGIESLICAGKANREAICIRGKSAGGYAVLRALTEHAESFKAGACYYGIGNLTTLTELTHKFEKYYTDSLIGEAYDGEHSSSEHSLFYQRSPSHFMNKVTSSMIIFQGLEDKIVPPEVAEEVIGMLKKSNVTHRYVCYPDEGHGFRQVVNNVDALSQELEFYNNVLSQ